MSKIGGTAYEVYSNLLQKNLEQTPHICFLPTVVSSAFHYLSLIIRFHIIGDKPIVINQALLQHRAATIFMCNPPCLSATVIIHFSYIQGDTCSNVLNECSGLQACWKSLVVSKRLNFDLLAFNISWRTKMHKYYSQT